MTSNQLLQTRITALCAWRQPDCGTPPLAFLPAMTRRRLSPLARLALQAAHEVLPDNAPARLVFASRHGEIASTDAMLLDAINSRPVSPAAFSHSVHNAIAGLWSISNKQTLETSAIAAGLDTLPMGMLEATAMLEEDRNTPVILIYADEPPTARFAPYATEPAHAFALALRLEAGPANLALCSTNASTHTDDFALAWQAGNRSWQQPGERHGWLWQRLESTHG